MSVKFSLFKVFFSAHVTLICLTASLTAYNSYVSFYEVKPGVVLNKLSIWVSGIVHSLSAQNYAFFSGIDTGYGFYAPNVKVGSTLQIDVDGKLFMPKLQTHEGNHMMRVLIGGMTNQILESMEQPETEEDSLFLSMEAELNELFLKNIGIYTVLNTIGLENCTDFKVHYCLLNYPSLEGHFSGSAIPELTQVKTVHICK
jgi:hypothetical protein